jgi:hypothetical protein
VLCCCKVGRASFPSGFCAMLVLLAPQSGSVKVLTQGFFSGMLLMTLRIWPCELKLLQW